MKSSDDKKFSKNYLLKLIIPSIVGLVLFMTLLGIFASNYYSRLENQTSSEEVISKEEISKEEETRLELSSEQNLDSTFQIESQEVKEVETDKETEEDSLSEEIIESEEPSEFSEEVNQFEPYFNFTDDERWLFTQVVFLEAGGESYDCQLMVASVIVNRMITENKSLYDVIYAPGQFSVTSAIGLYEPSETSYQVVDKIEKEGPSLPVCVTYFRANYYHDWSGVCPYDNIDNVYFSHDLSLCNLEGGCRGG